MPRLKRVQFAGALYHVMARGNRKNAIFEDAIDKRMFLQVLREAITRYDAPCLAYCLMGNHYHLLLETPRGNIADVMRHLNGLYTQRSNRRHKRTGHVFEGRYRSLLIQRESYLRRVVRYIVRNPVRAGLVRTASAWLWSSYRATVGVTKAPEWLSIEWLLTVFPSESLAAGQKNYALFVNDPTSQTERVDLTAQVLGDRIFSAAFKEAATQRHDELPLPRRVVALARPPLGELLAGATAVGTVVRRDRQIATAHIDHGYRLAEIAAFLQLDPSSASKALRRHLARGS